MDVLPEDYVIEIEGKWCGLCIDSMIIDEWILGDSFMRGWYNIHDLSTTPPRMGFTPFTGSNKSLPTLATSTPKERLPLGFVFITGVFIWGYRGFIVIPVLLALLAGIVYLIVIAWRYLRTLTMVARKGEKESIKAK